MGTDILTVNRYKGKYPIGNKSIETFPFVWPDSLFPSQLSAFIHSNHLLIMMVTIFKFSLSVHMVSSIV